MTAQQWCCAQHGCGTKNYMWQDDCRKCNSPWKGPEKIVTLVDRSLSAKRRERDARKESEMEKRVLAKLKGRERSPNRTAAAPFPRAAAAAMASAAGRSASSIVRWPLLAPPYLWKGLRIIF